MNLFDVNTKEQSYAGARMVLENPDTLKPMTGKAAKDKEPRDQYLLMLGPETARVKRISVEQAMAAQELMKRRTEGKVTDEDYETHADEEALRLASCCIGGEVFVEGKWLKVDEELAQRIFSHAEHWRLQAIKFMGERGNYRAASAAA